MPGSCSLMDLPGRSYAWEGERMPHHLPSAFGEPSTSGRAVAARPGSGDPRSTARLPRSSRNGVESLPYEAAEDVIGNPEYGPRRASDLRVRPPSASVLDAAPLSGRKSRRTSLVGLLGLKSGGSGQDAAKAPSREITLQGMASTTLPAGRMRRHSLLHTFGFGFGSTAQEHEESLDAVAAQRQTGSKSASQDRRRRASMFDLFKHSHIPDPGVEGAEQLSPNIDAHQRPLGRKSRRASFIDFFRPSNTGMQTGDLSVVSTAVSRSGRGFSLRGDGVASGRAQRRKSVIDILGHSSKKVLAKLMHHEYEDDDGDDEEAEDGRLWFTSLADFKPLTFKYLSGRYSSAFFACSVKTGQHYILKQFEKGKMSLTDERGVRRALAFAHMLEHAHIVRCCGTWEDEEALYIVEEYAVKGDLLQDSMSHPEKYTEAFMATKVVKPLLEVLVYLHNINVVHRAIFPEYVMFGREDQLKLGHFTSAIDQRLDPPTERIPFLDYMAPEMLAVRVDEPGGPFSAAAAAAAGTGTGPGASSSARPKGLSSQQTRVVRLQGMPGLSNDGSMAPGGSYPASSGPSSTMQPPPIPPGAYDSAEYGRPSPLTLNSGNGSRHGLFDLPGSPLSPPDSLPSLPEKSQLSRGSTNRSGFGLLRSMRRLTSHQQLSDEDGSCSKEPSTSSRHWASTSPSRRLRGEAAEAPWLIPTRPSDCGGARSSGSGGGAARGLGPGAHTYRRRKSALEEMSAPWLRPLDASASGTENEVADVCSGAALQPEGGETMVGAVGGPSAAAAAGSSPRADSHGHGASTAPTTDACGVGSNSMVSRSGDGNPALVHEPSEGPRSLTRMPSSSLGGGGRLDGTKPHDLLGLPGSQPRPPEGFSLRKQLSSAAVVAGAPVPLPAPCASRSTVRPGSSGWPSAPSSLPAHEHDDDCLPGYAADPPEDSPQQPHPTSTGGLRQASSRVHRSGELSPSMSLGAAVAAASPGAGPAGVGSPSPGPVGEALVPPGAATAISPSGISGRSSPGHDSADLSVFATDASVYATEGPPPVSEFKRARTGVSFTTTKTGAGDEPGDDDASVSSRRMRSRIASREMSVTNAITGLRSMARSFTMKIGYSLKGLGGEGQGSVPASAEVPGEVAGGSAGVGMGGAAAGGVGNGSRTAMGRDTTPQQSLSGGVDATSIFVPSNPWEWQEHYDEKVDLWQVGCLVHEILCLSLPFEAEDKLLACALILWADIASFPDHLSPECQSFIRACLTKDPAERPSAAELLQHPWIVRHAAGEVLKSVRQQREEASLAALSAEQQLTPVQRAAAAVGLGWLVGVGADGGGGGSGSGSLRPQQSGVGGGSQQQQQQPGYWSWLLRPWTAKVQPDGAGADSGKGGAAFKRAMAIVQEHQQQKLQQGAFGGMDASTKAQSVGGDLEAGQGQHRGHSLDASRNSYHAFGAGPGGARASNSTRWGVVL